MTDIRIQSLDEHNYGVRVVEGDTVTDHKVRVTEDFLDDLGMVDVDEERLVRETIDFLLDREKNTSIYEEFDLEVVTNHFPDYLDEIRTRLS